MGLNIQFDKKESSTNVKMGSNKTFKVNSREINNSAKIAPTDRKKIEPKDPKKRSLGKTYFTIIAIFAMCVGGVFGYNWVKNEAADNGFKISIKDTVSAVVNKDPELKKDSTGKRTNVLLVGIDSRDLSKGGAINTDTLIVASYHHEKNEVVMISIPRDSTASMPGEDWYNKVNSIYANAESREPGSGMETLELVIEDMLDLEIQYYAMVDLKGFVDGIDTLGGIDVDVERAFTDYAFPLPDYSDTKVVSFEEGLQTMDGETAMYYARSRHALGPEGTDFARARRQQNVIIAAKDKALSKASDFDANTLLEMYGNFKANTEVSEFTPEDVRAALALKDKAADIKVYSFVLDPYIANNSILVTGVTEGYSIGPKLGLGKYDDLQKYVATVMENPEFYSTNPVVHIFDVGVGYNNGYKEALELQKLYPYNTIIYMGTLQSGQSGTYIYDNSGSEDIDYSAFINALAKSKKYSSTEKPEFIVNRPSVADVIILLGLEEVEAAETTTE